MSTYQRYKHKYREYDKNRIRNKQMNIRVSEQEKEIFKKALEYYGLNFNSFVIDKCNEVVEQYKNEVNGGKE